MGQAVEGLSSKLRFAPGGYAHWCPGCEGGHVIMTQSEPDFPGPSWTFDGNFESPTFNPSVKIGYKRPDAACCHYYLHEGVLKYCGDSTHKLAGKNVPLPDWPDGLWDGDVVR
jgi:Family of unknown function (DUF6527)